MARVLQISGLVRSLALAVFGVCLLSACATRASEENTLLSAEAALDLAFDACMARCNENSPLGSLTREGCYKGCYETRRQTLFRGPVYSSAADCLSFMEGFDLNRDLYVESMQGWCWQQWSLVYNIIGCRDAVSVFYAALTPESVCLGKPALSTPPADGRGTIVPPLPSAQPPALLDTPKYRKSAPAKKQPVKNTPKAPAKAATPSKETTPEKDTPAPNPVVSAPPAPAEGAKVPVEAPQALSVEALPQPVGLPPRAHGQDFPGECSASMPD